MGIRILLAHMLNLCDADADCLIAVLFRVAPPIMHASCGGDQGFVFFFLAQELVVFEEVLIEGWNGDEVKMMHACRKRCRVQGLGFRV